MKLGLGVGITYIAANQHLTAGGGGGPSILYGLIDDGEGGWEWSEEPNYGLTDAGMNNWEWDGLDYLLDFDNAEWEEP